LKVKSDYHQSTAQSRKKVMIEGKMQDETFVSIVDRWKACQEDAAKKSSFNTPPEPVVVVQMPSAALSTNRKWKAMQNGDLGEIRLQPSQASDSHFISAAGSNVLKLKPSVDFSSQIKEQQNERKFEMKRLNLLSDSDSTRRAISTGRVRMDTAKFDLFVGGSKKSVTKDIVVADSLAGRDFSITSGKKERYSLPEDSWNTQHATSSAITRNGRSSMPQKKSVDEPPIQCKRKSFDSDTQTDFARSVRKFDSTAREAISNERTSQPIRTFFHPETGGVLQSTKKQGVSSNEYVPFSKEPLSKELGSTFTRTASQQEVGGVRQSISNQIVSSTAFSQRKQLPLLLTFGDDMSTRPSSISINAVVSNLEKAAKVAESRKSVVPVSFHASSVKKVSPKNETKWKHTKPCSDGTKQPFGSEDQLWPVTQTSDEERSSDLDVRKRKSDTNSNLQSVLNSLKKVDLPEEEKWKKKVTDANNEGATDQRPIYVVTKKLNPALAKSTAILEFPRNRTSGDIEASIDQRTIYVPGKKIDQNHLKSPKYQSSERSEQTCAIGRKLDKNHSKSPRTRSSESFETSINQRPINAVGKTIDQNHSKSKTKPDYLRNQISERSTPRDFWTAPEKQLEIVEPIVNKVTNNAIGATAKCLSRIHPKEPTCLSPQSKNEGGEGNPPPPFTFRQSSTSKELEALRSLGLHNPKIEMHETTCNKLVDSVTTAAIKTSTRVQPKEISPQSKNEECPAESTFSFRQSSTSKELEVLRSLGLTKKVTLTNNTTTAPSSCRDENSQKDELCVKELAKTFAAKATMSVPTKNRSLLESKNVLNTKLASASHTAMTSMSSSPERTRKLSSTGESGQLRGSLRVTSYKSKETTVLLLDHGESQTLDLPTSEVLSNKKRSAQEELSFIRSLGLAKTLSLNPSTGSTMQKMSFKSSSRIRSVCVTNDVRRSVGQPREAIILSANQPRASSVGRTRPMAQDTFPPPSWASQLGTDAHSVTSLPIEFDASRSVGSLRPSSSSCLDRHSPSIHPLRTMDHEMDDNLLPAMSMNSEYTTESEFDIASENYCHDNRYIQISLSSGGIAEKYEPNIVVSPTTESTDDSEGLLSESPAGSSVDNYEIRGSRRRKSREPFRGAKRFFFGKKKRSVD
jgi:hypothetical protein